MFLLRPDPETLIRTTKFGYWYMDDVDNHSVLFSSKFKNISESLGDLTALCLSETDLEGGLPPFVVSVDQTDSMIFGAGTESDNWRFITAKRSASFIRWAMAKDGSYLYQHTTQLSRKTLSESYRDTIDKLPPVILSAAGLGTFYSLKT